MVLNQTYIETNKYHFFIIENARLRCKPTLTNNTSYWMQITVWKVGSLESIFISIFETTKTYDPVENLRTFDIH